MFEFYLGKGIIMGIVFGVPAGAIGVLTLKNTLNRGFISGLSTGLGSSVADLVYGIISVLGISLISEFMLRWQQPLSIAAGLVISIIGFTTIFNINSESKHSSGNKENVGFFLTAFLIAIMNPATILSFIVAFAAFEIPGNLQLMHCCKLILGIFIGTIIWWITLSGGVTILKSKVSNNIFRTLHKTFGILLIIFGLYILISNTLEALNII